MAIQVPKLLALNERRQRQPNNTFSRSRPDEAGIMILSFPDEQKELESKVKKLTEDLSGKEKERFELELQVKKLLADIGEIEFEEEKEPGDIKKCFPLELNGDPIELESKMKKLSRDLETMEAQVVVPIKENEEKAIEIKQMNHLLGCDEEI